MELGALKNGVEFCTEDLEALEQVIVHTPEFMTVENKTSFIVVRIRRSVFLSGRLCNPISARFPKTGISE